MTEKIIAVEIFEKRGSSTILNHCYCLICFYRPPLNHSLNVCVCMWIQVCILMSFSSVLHLLSCTHLPFFSLSSSPSLCYSLCCFEAFSSRNVNSTGSSEPPTCWKSLRDMFGGLLQRESLAERCGEKLKQHNMWPLSFYPPQLTAISPVSDYNVSGRIHHHTFTPSSSPSPLCRWQV